MSLNRVVITGNLGSDPELRKTQSGMAIMSMNVAVNERRKNSQTGEYEDYVNWVGCTMFGSRAESVSNFISKGSKVAIDGKLRYSTWDDKQGNKRSKLEVVVDDIEFMSRESGSKPQNQQQRNSTPSTQYPDASVYSDDIPF